MIEPVDLMIKYKLSPALAQALVLLLTNKIVTSAMVEVNQPITTDGKVLMHRLRRRLAGKFEIRSQRSVGYWLDQDTKDAVMADVANEPKESPLGYDGGEAETVPSAA